MIGLVVGHDWEIKKAHSTVKKQMIRSFSTLIESLLNDMGKK